MTKTNEFVSTVTLKSSMDDVVNPGDFCFTQDGSVILACPVCAVVFSCHHTIEQRNPLTLSPSVVGPTSGFAWGDRAKEVFDKADDVARSQILSPCGHHFWIQNGEVNL